MSTNTMESPEATMSSITRTDADEAKVASGQPGSDLPPSGQALVQALVNSHHQGYSHVHQHLPFLTVSDGQDQPLQHAVTDPNDPAFLPPNPGAPMKIKRPRGTDEEGKPKTKRIFQACSKCRERKAKCDGNRPTCSSCIQRGLECEYSAERKMRGPSKKRLREDGQPAVPKKRRTNAATFPGDQPAPPPGQYHPMHDPNAPPPYIMGPQGYEPNPHYYQHPYHPGHPYPPPSDGSAPLAYPPMHPPHDGPPPGPIDMNGNPYPAPHPPYDPSVYGHPPPFPPQFANQPPYEYPPPQQVPSFQQPMQPVRPAPERSPEPQAGPGQAPNPSNYMTREDFNALMDRYLNSLSRKNREKALLTQAVYNDILKLLIAGQEEEQQAANSTADPDANHSIPNPDVQIDPSIDTPQFRFWVRKMFVVQKIAGVDVVTHHEKPVAVQEQLYDILIHCHGQTGHGGRDKTSAMVNEHYSWIPKVFIETFVKNCPGCPRKLSAAKRSAGGNGDAQNDEDVQQEGSEAPVSPTASENHGPDFPVVADGSSSPSGRNGAGDVPTDPNLLPPEEQPEEEEAEAAPES